jgi:hypothetical protein
MSNGDQEKEKVGGWDVTQWYSLAYVRPWTPSQHQKRKKKKEKRKLNAGMVVYPCNPSTGEVKAGGLQI